MPTCSGSVCGTGGWTGPLPGDPSDAATLTATPEFGGIELAWSEPAVNPFAVAYTKIYRSSTADFANAITLPASGGSTYFDRMEDGLTFWYWIRFVSINGTEGELVGPASATSGSMVQDLLDKLLGNLTDNQLSNELRTELGRIELLNGQIGQEIAERQAALDLIQGNLDAMQDEIAASSALLLQEVSQRAVSVNTEISDRIAAINGLRTEVAGNALTLETDLTTAFQAADAATLASANSFTYSRATIDAADAATLDTLRTELTAGLGATLTSAQSYVQGYTYSFSGVDSAIADIATVLRSEFQTADSNAAAYLSTNHYTKAEADSAMASSTNTLRSQLTGGYAGTDLNQVMSGLLYIERTTRASEDQALSQQISLLSAGSNDQFDYSNIWYFDSSVDGWDTATAGVTVSQVGGWLRMVSDSGSVSNPILQSPAGLTIDAAKYTQVRCRIRKVGNPTWEGTCYYQTVADPTYTGAKSITVSEPSYDGNGIALLTFNADSDWVGTISRIRLDLAPNITPTDYFEFDWVAVGRPSPGASAAELLAEQTARINGDTAEVAARETLSTVVTGQANPTGLTVPTLSSGLLYDERQLRSAADQTEITARQALSTKVTGAADPSSLTLSTLSSGLLYEERQLRATADSNEITARQALSTKVTGVADPAGLTLASLSSGLLYEERQARSTADASEVTARQDLSTKVTGAANPASLTLATLSAGLLYDERQARSTADSTEVSARQALSAKITGANDPASLTLATLSAGLLYDERQARVTADNSQVSRLDALEATVNNGTTGVAATAAALDTVELLVNNGTTGVTATANKVSTLQARVDASPNLWPNAEFIAGAGAWPDSVMFDRTAAGVPAAAPSSRVLRTTASSLASTAAMPFFVTAGQVLETEVWVHSDVAQNWRVYYTATDDADVPYLSGNWQALMPSTAVPANTWTKLKGVATIPVGATKLRVVLDPTAGSGTHISHVAKPSIREKTASMASIEETSTTTVSDLNNVKAQWTMKVQARTDTKQVMAGIGLAATAAGSVGQSEMIFMADRFAWVPPGNINAAPNGLLQAGLVDGVSTWVFPSTMLGDQSVGARVVIDGTLEARHIKANELKVDNALTRGLTVRDDAGNIILSSGNALDFSRVGGATRPANNATVGAQAGVNLLDSLGASVSDLAFLNKYSNGDQLAGDLSGNPFMKRVDTLLDRPWGVKAGYQTTDQNVVSYGDAPTRSILRVKDPGNSDNSIGVVWPAFRAQPNMRYRAFVRWRASAAGTGSRVFMRFLSKTTEINQGATHIGFSTGEAGVDTGGDSGGNTAKVISDTSGTSAGASFEARPVPAANTWYETVVEYTPASDTKWVSFSLLRWNGFPSASDYVEVDSCFIYAVTTAEDGATVGATFGVNIGGQITSVNVSTYIAAAAIGWAQIGSLDINANGYIRSGKTAWGSGNGWYLGRDAGEASLDIGDTNAYLRYKPSTGLQIKLPTGVTGTVTGFADAHNTSTSSTAEATSSGSITGVTGGLSPYIYDWSLNVIETWGGTSREIKFSPSGSLASVSIKGGNTAAQVGVQCRIIDSNGRVAVLGKIITIRTGTATATPP